MTQAGSSNEAQYIYGRLQLWQHTDAMITVAAHACVCCTPGKRKIPGCRRESQQCFASGLRRLIPHVWHFGAC